MKSVDSLGREIETGDICAVTKSKDGRIWYGKVLDNLGYGTVVLKTYVDEKYKTTNRVTFKDLLKPPLGFYKETRSSSIRLLILKRAKS